MMKMSLSVRPCNAVYSRERTEREDCRYDANRASTCFTDCLLRI